MQPGRFRRERVAEPHAAKQRLDPHQPAARHGRRAFRFQRAGEHDFARAEHLPDIMRGEPRPPLGRRQAERLAHGAVEPRPRIGGFRPGAFIQPGDDDQIGRGQPRLHGIEDLQARMRGARRPHGFEPDQAAEQRRVIGERKGKACRFARQRGHEGGDRFAVRAVLKWRSLCRFRRRRRRRRIGHGRRQSRQDLCFAAVRTE